MTKVTTVEELKKYIQIEDVNLNMSLPFRILKDLFHKLVMMRVKLYYLYSMDSIQGSNHFKVPVSKRLEILEKLIVWSSEYCVPNYIIDSPGGKIRILPNIFVYFPYANKLQITNHFFSKHHTI